MSSNVISLIASILTGLVVPKILGATNYGYYRMFILYTTYTSFLHFGFIDGLLLKDGGKDSYKLNKLQYRSNSRIFITIQFFIALCFVILSLIINSHVISMLFLTIGIGTFFLNVTTYYRFISQIIMRFKELSIRNTIQACLIIVVTVFLWLFKDSQIIKSFAYSVYIWLMLMVYFVMFLIYVYSYRNVTLGQHDSIRLGAYRILYYCRMGIYLTIAYQISNLIMIIDNQIVAMFFKTSVYGKYSFSYSMTNTAITILSAIATVLLPHLKRDTFHHMINNYHKMISIIMLVVYFGLLAYFPLCLLIKIILPEYIQSLNYLKFFLPELGITCSVTMITFNYYNALGKSKFYFYMSLIILIISTIIDLLMYILFHNPIWVAFGSFISIFIWYLASEYFLVKWYHIQWIRNLIYMILMIGSFLIVSIIHNIILGFIIYLIVYLIISITMFKSFISKSIYIILRNL